MSRVQHRSAGRAATAEPAAREPGFRWPGAELLRRYGALLVDAMALLLMVLLGPEGQTFGLAALLAGIILISWLGGILAGLASVLLGVLAANYFVLTPYTLALSSPEDYVRLYSFAVVGLLVSWMNSSEASTLRLEQRRREAERRRVWLETVLTLQPTPLFLIDPLTARVTFRNDAAASLLRGVPDPGAEHWLDLVAEEDRPEASHVWNGALAARDALGLECRLRRPDGSRIWSVVNAAPAETPSGELVAYIVNVTDISEQKETEQSLRLLAEQRASLVATVSHVLRAPLTSALVNLDVLADGTYGALTPRQREAVERAIRPGLELSRTVDALLELSRLQSGRVTVEPQRLRVEPFLRELIDELAVRASARGVVLELAPSPGLPPLVTDPRLLAWIVTELLENAVKYTRPATRVRAGAFLADDRVAFRVEDEGLGIPPGELPQIFDPFFRGKRAQREQIRGSGLGLQIAREAAQLLGGELRAGNRPQGGAIFELHLPLSPPCRRSDTGATPS
ncbi:MAG: ATP-binding protein [Armatimonadota bacterium]